MQVVLFAGDSGYFALSHTGIAKFGFLCELYSRNKKKISKADNRNVLEHLRAR